MRTTGSAAVLLSPTRVIGIGIVRLLMTLFARTFVLCILVLLHGSSLGLLPLRFTIASVVLLFLLFLFVKAVQILLSSQVYGPFRLFVSSFFQSLRFFSALVHLYDVHGPLSTYGDQIGRHTLVCRVSDHPQKDITFEEEVVTFHALQLYVTRGQFSVSFHILVHLIVHAAFQLGTLAGKLLWITTQVLITGTSRTHAHKVLHPRGTTEFTSTGSKPSYATSLLSGTYLFHLYAYMKRLGKHLDELTEVHTSVGNVIEDGLVAVALIFHISYLHFQSQVLGYLSTAYHGIVFQSLGLLVFFHVGRACLSVDAPYFLVTLQIGLFHL